MSIADDMNDRSADEIALEVELSRARVTETLDELKARMSPGQLVDEVLAYSKGAGGEFLANAGRAARDNPLPVLLVGAGLALLATSRGSGSDRPSRPTPRYGHDDDFSYGRGGSRDSGLGSKASDAAATVRDAAESGLDTAKDGLSRVGDVVSDAASTASDMAGSVYRRTSDMAGSVGETLSNTGDYARRVLHDRRDDLAHLGTSARRRAMGLFEDQPLVVAALGLAIGAAMGAALPRSRTEDRLMGEAAERAREAAREAAEAGYRQARDVVEDTIRHVTDELSERGLSTDAVREAAEAAAEKAREAAMRGMGQDKPEQRDADRNEASGGPRSGRPPYGAAGGEGFVPPRAGSGEGPGAAPKMRSDTAPGAPSTRTGPVI